MLSRRNARASRGLSPEHGDDSVGAAGLLGSADLTPEAETTVGRLGRNFQYFAIDPFNLFRDDTIGDESDPTGYRAQSAQLAPRFGASRLAMTVYDLPPGPGDLPLSLPLGR